MDNEIEHEKYRLTFVCECGGDIVYGFGPTIRSAARVARGLLTKHYRGQRMTKRLASDVWLEVAVRHGGGSHYEETPAPRWIEALQYSEIPCDTVREMREPTGSTAALQYSETRSDRKGG